MSYLKTMAKAKAYAAKEASKDTAEVNGPFDLLIGSPQKGNGTECWYILCKANQLNTTGWKTFKKWFKDLKKLGGTKGWAFSFDGGSKWCVHVHGYRTHTACHRTTCHQTPPSLELPNVRA